MFPHFLKEREIISSSPQVFASSCFVSHYVVPRFLVLVGSFFGSVLFCMEGGAGRISRPLLSFGCMFVG